MSSEDTLKDIKEKENHSEQGWVYVWFLIYRNFAKIPLDEKEWVFQNIFYSYVTTWYKDTLQWEYLDLNVA